MEKYFFLLVNSTWHILWWGTDWDWECLPRKTRKQSNHILSISVFHTLCVCDVLLLPVAGCGIWIGPLVHTDGPEPLFSWRSRLLFGILEAPALLSVTAHFIRMINPFFPRKSRCRFCFFLLLIHLDNSLYNHMQNYSSLI